MQNTVMQLNMGEGKSSVIVPAVAAALADGSRLVRVIVAKPQSQQMHHMLVATLGGLVARQVFHIPFSRTLRLMESDTAAIHAACVRCQEAGGVLLVQPEHLLSMQLMGLECLINGRAIVAAGLLRTQHLFATAARDVVDESDENFSVKFELVYTMGQQRPVEFAPSRWVTIQAVLDVLRRHIPEACASHPHSLEAVARHPGSFPRLRVYDAVAMDLLLYNTARDICTAGLPGLVISHQSPAVRDAILGYVTEPHPRPEDVAAVEGSVFWAPASRSNLLLLRGLFAGGILFFVFGQKRWRVHYGVDNSHQPPTMLAVPYRAKDSPSRRSEFSHPDVVIALTCTSYYYQGLCDDDLFRAFDHLINSDQADSEYHAWTQGADGLAPPFRHLMGVNLKDRFQCVADVFPAFRFTKRTIDYFLHSIVFSRQMREFPHKLSASGWDIGAAKAHPTTGFSGTIDSWRLLPLDVCYLDLASQKHTNTLVLRHLLQPENGVLHLPAAVRGDGPSVAETLVNLIVDQRDPRLRVVLDVGAQILEWTNAQVAAEWLRLERSRDCPAAATASPVEAAVFFNDCEELMVLDYRGRTESLHTSPYAEQLDACIVFLDEAHTRGTDLRLPRDYRAAVTLGALLTKDRLVQACMRMRGLGRGQSVVFCIPEEIHLKIRANTIAPAGQDPAPIRVLDVLEWAIGETHHDLRKSMSLWALQGQRFERQRLLWEAAHDGTEIHMSDALANAFLEDEAQTLQKLYLPGKENDIDGAEQSANGTPGQEGSADKTTARLAQIRDRCRQVADVDSGNAALHEEQERELSPEIEEERQVQHPAPVRPADHKLDPLLIRLARHGTPLPADSPACMPAFSTLRASSAAMLLDVAQFPGDLLVTADFATTVNVPPAEKHTFVSDTYHRPVQWLLASHSPHNCSKQGSKAADGCCWTQLVIISPFEANALLPMLRIRSRSSPATTPALHLYAPRPNLEVASLERLDLYTVWPGSPELHPPLSHYPPPPPRRLATLLNLFAGQLYFDTPAAYRDLCAMLRLSDQKAGPGTAVAADGFLLRTPAGSATAAVIANSTFRQSPVAFLKSFLLRARKDCQVIDKTHLGRVLDGQLLTDSDFADSDCQDDA